MLTEFAVQPPKLTTPKPERDPVREMMASANRLPVWLHLQHEIGLEIDDLVKWLSMRTTSDPELARRLQKINDQIEQYNRQVPSIYFQKQKLTPDNVVIQAEQWD